MERNYHYSFGLGEIVEITVAQSDYKPIFAFEKAWVRIGKSNIKLSTNELRELIRRYSYQEFDSQISKSKTIASEFDSDIYKKFISLGYNFPKDLNIAEYLSFTKINTDYPQAIVKAARFKGNKPVIFLDTRNFDKSLILITDQVLEFIKKNIRLQYIITGKAALFHETKHYLNSFILSVKLKIGEPVLPAFPMHVLKMEILLQYLKSVAEHS